VAESSLPDTTFDVPARPVSLPDAARAAEPTAPDRPGTDSQPFGKAGRNLLFDEIARGGMGAVLRGRDPDLGRDLAVKVLLETYHHQPEMVRRFLEEAQIAGQLQHPGVVPVYELGRFADDRPFFTMKLVKGQTPAALPHRRHPRAVVQAARPLRRGTVRTRGGHATFPLVLYAPLVLFSAVYPSARRGGQAKSLNYMPFPFFGLAGLSGGGAAGAGGAPPQSASWRLMSSKSTRAHRSANWPSTNRQRSWTSKRIFRPVAGIPKISPV
jgi:hypothetical protein